VHFAAATDALLAGCVLQCKLTTGDVALAPKSMTPHVDSTVTVADLAVDVVSDVVCPWCYIGKRKLERALAELRAREPGIGIAVRWHPFELNPDLPAEGILRTDYLKAKFGAERATEIYARVRAVGLEVGIAFDFERITRQPNTRDAHRLIAWAQHAGDAEPLVEQLFRGYFIEGRPLSDPAELCRIAEAAGLPRQGAEALLASEGLRAEVDAEYRGAQDAGITGVPFFIFNGRTAVSGAHDPPTLLEAIAAARAAV
jgi:predicted DsbA family dithiol-disulfide isomerase